MATANEEIIRRINAGQMTHQQADALFARAGINIPGGGGARTNYLLSNPAANQRLASMLNGQGAMPVGIEPLHQFERNALTALGNPTSIAAMGVNPLSSTFLQNIEKYGNKADAALKAGMKGFDLKEVQQYFNPAQEAVTNRAVSRLTDRAKSLQEDMMHRLSQRGSATMGDLFGAQQMGKIQEELVKSTGDIEAQGAYQNWIDAIGSMFQNRSNALAAGNVYAGMMNPMANAANTAQGVQNQALQGGLTMLGAQQAAGQRIQGFNQGVADIALQNYMNQRNFPNTITQQAFGTFGVLSNPSLIAQTPLGNSNTGSAIGSALGGLGGFAVDAFGGNNMLTRALGIENNKLETRK
jgi:hypothetical protein